MYYQADTDEGGRTMKAGKIVGIILVILGALVVLGSALANLLPGHRAGFGFIQIGGMAVGVIDVVLGLILLLQKKPQ
jgi:hypothetical protein